jgi:hypothetical protein
MRRENEKMAFIDEVNQFITTDEGRAWLDGQKASLLEHKDQVLAELKKTNGEYSELKQRFEETENTLQSEKAVTSKYLIDNELTRLLKQANVFDDAIPQTIETLKSAYGLTVKTSGNDRTAIGVLKNESGEDTEAALEAVVKNWAGLPGSKYFIQATSTGGGAPGGSYRGSPPPALNRLSGQALASMTDEQFRNARNNALNSAKE